MLTRLRRLPVLLVLALLVGTALRIIPVARADFPLNDGGMFLTMIRDLQSSAFAPPETTTYNLIGIPFAYPPFGFYLAAAIASLFGTDPIGLLRVLPCVFSILTLGAFALLAYTVLPSRTGAGVATLLFAILPGAFVWEIMGGGLTRSPGMLFAILALREVYLLYVRPTHRAWLLTVVFSSATILSHMDWALFLAVSVLALLLAFGRSRSAIDATVLAGVAILAATAPWWAVMVGRFGLAPFQAASQTGSVVPYIASQSGLPPSLVIVLMVLVPAVVFVGMTAIPDRRCFIVGWVGLLAVADVRSFHQLAEVPAALGAGYLVGAALAPRRRRAAAVADGAAGVAARRPRTTVIAEALAIAVIGALLWMNISSIPDLGHVLRALSPAQRQAMAWVANETPPASRILVISVGEWALDVEGEWFPAVAHRPSITTVQGTEWLPGEFFRRRELQALALSCGDRTADCLDRWMARTHESFTYVYLVRDAPTDCCASLAASLRADPAYELVFDGPGATIFARKDLGP